MGMLDFLKGGVGGELAKGAMDIAKGFFPAKLSEEDEKRLAMQFQSLTNNHIKEMQIVANEEQAEFNKRTTEMEGTAKDLKAIPILGPIIIFLRGAQRPVWGFSTLVMDFMWLSNSWDFSDNEQKGTMMIVVNVLVLGFLFGERAVKNLMPLLLKVFAK